MLFAVFRSSTDIELYRIGKRTVRNVVVAVDTSHIDLCYARNDEKYDLEPGRNLKSYSRYLLRLICLLWDLDCSRRYS